MENHLVPEVLELYERVLAVPPHYGLHELIDEVVVAKKINFFLKSLIIGVKSKCDSLLSRDPLVPAPDVVLVLQVSLVVGPHVERDREALVRADAGQGRVQRELANGDAHALEQSA